MSELEGLEDDQIAPVEQASVGWAERAARNTEALRETLSELGIPDAELQRDVEAFEQVKDAIGRRPSITENPHIHGKWGGDPDEWERVRWEEEQQKRRDVVTWLKNWLTGSSFRVLETTTTEIRVPLFILGAPPVAGSRITYAESTLESTTSGWSVTVFGSGGGDDQILSLRETSTFVARDGVRKQIVVPATLAVSRVGTYRGEKQIAEGVRTELVTVGKAVPELLDTATSPEYDPSTEPFGWELSRDPTRDISSYKLDTSFVGKFTFGAGIEAFKSVSATVRVEVDQERTATIEFELPGGSDYGFRYLSRPNGVWCIEPTG